jgi:elongation factor P
MADTGDISIGSVIRFNGELCQVIEYQHRTPGNLRAFFQAKMRNLKTGKLVENRFRAGESVEVARVEYKTLQYLYKKQAAQFRCLFFCLHPIKNNKTE